MRSASFASSLTSPPGGRRSRGSSSRGPPKSGRSSGGRAGSAGGSGGTSSSRARAGSAGQDTKNARLAAMQEQKRKWFEQRERALSASSGLTSSGQSSSSLPVSSMAAPSSAPASSASSVAGATTRPPVAATHAPAHHPHYGSDGGMLGVPPATTGHVYGSSWTSLPGGALPPASAYGGFETSTVAPAWPPSTSTAQVGDDMLSKLTERITSKLRVDLQEEIRKETALEAEKQEELRSKLESYLQTELQSHSCPKCAQLMAPPERAPILLFPCGHTFCKLCVDSHRASRNSCPFCCTPIESAAENHTVSRLIQTFVAKRQQYFAGQMPSFEGTDPSAAIAFGQVSARLSAAGASVMGVPPSSMGMQGPTTGGFQRPPTGPGIGFVPRAYTPAGWSGSTGTTTPASSESMDQGIRYLHDLRSFCMRHQILANEYSSTAQRAQEADEQVAATDGTIKHLQQRQDSIRKQIEQLKAEEELVTSHIAEQERKKAEVYESAKTVREQVALLSQTIQGLRRDIEKSKLLVENFAPHLLTADDMAALPPGT